MKIKMLINFSNTLRGGDIVEAIANPTVEGEVFAYDKAGIGWTLFEGNYEIYHDTVEAPEKDSYAYLVEKEKQRPKFKLGVSELLGDVKSMTVEFK